MGGGLQQPARVDVVNSNNGDVSEAYCELGMLLLAELLQSSGHSLSVFFKGRWIWWCCVDVGDCTAAVCVWSK